MEGTFSFILHCPLDGFGVLHLLGDVVCDSLLTLVVFGWCLGSSDKDVIPKFLVCPFWWGKRCVLVVPLGRVVPGCSLTSVVVIRVPAGTVVGPGGVAPCSVVVVVVVVHIRMFAV